MHIMGNQEHRRLYEVAKQLGAKPTDSTEQLAALLEAAGVDLKQPWYEATADRP